MQSYHPPATPLSRTASPAVIDSPDGEKESHMGAHTVAARTVLEESESTLRTYEENRERYVASVLDSRLLAHVRII